MDVRINSYWLIYLRLVLSSIFLLFAFSCDQKTSKTKSNLLVAETDSILTWVFTARNTDLVFVERKRILERALKEVEGRESDSTKLQYLSKIQWAYLELRDSLPFRQTNIEAINLAKTLADSVKLAGRYWDLGYFMKVQKVKDSAYYYYSQASNIYLQNGNPLNAAILLIDMANIQSEVKDYTGGEINAISAIKLLKPLNDYKELYRAYNILGIITKDLGEYGRSLAYYEEARSYLNKVKPKKLLEPQADNNLGVVYKEMGNYKKAVFYFEKILLQDSIRNKNPQLYATTLTNLAESRSKIDSSANVETLFNMALTVRDSIGDLAGVAASHYYLAEYHLSKKDTLTALSHGLRSKDYAIKSDNYERLLKTLKMLMSIDRQNTALHTKYYLKLNDSLQLTERQIRDKFTRIQFETDEVVAENESLAKENQLWASIALGLFLLGFSVYIIANQRIKNQKLEFQQQQQTNNQEIFNLMLSQSQKLEEGKKFEQKRISEELHDGVLGKMLGARMLLTGLNKKSDTEAITQRSTAIEALKNVEGEVRAISHELSHAAYQKIHNFINSIQDLLNGIGQNAKIDCNFTYGNNLDWDGLNGDIKINVYRIVQECLQNAVKHAKCQHVLVDFEADDEHIKIQITDDGKGFEFKKAKRGIGIRNIRSRVLKLNGSWRVDSTPGSGTSIVITIPIKYYTNAMELNDDGVNFNKA